MVWYDKNNKIVNCDLIIIYVYIYIMIIFEINVFIEIVGNLFEKKENIICLYVYVMEILWGVLLGFRYFIIIGYMCYEVIVLVFNIKLFIYILIYYML